MDIAELKRVSKTMSWLLRHAAEQSGLLVDPEGFVPVDDLLVAMRQQQIDATRETLAAVIAQVEPTKQRFRLEGDWIRANYGHSLEQRVSHSAQVPPDVLLHGTSTDAAEQILRDGLRPMKRQYVHLTTDRTLAATIGRRHGKMCVLGVDARRAHEAGLPFFAANERFWLVEQVPAEFVFRAAEQP